MASKKDKKDNLHVEGWEDYGPSHAGVSAQFNYISSLGLDTTTVNSIISTENISARTSLNNLVGSYINEQKSKELMTDPPVQYEPGIRKVLVIGKAGIGKTSAMKGELVNGTVKLAKGARAGAKAGTTKVEKPHKVTIWGTKTQAYVIDTPGMFQTAMLKTFMKGSSTKTDFVFMCVDASQRITLENALTEVFTANTITEFDNNKRFAVLFLRMNVGEMFFNMSGEAFSEEIVREDFLEQMTLMLGDRYQKRTTYFYSYGGEEEQTKRGKTHWVKEFAAWLEQSKEYKREIEIDTSKVKKNPERFLKEVVEQVEPEFKKEAEQFIKKTCCHQFWGLFGY